MKKSRRSVRDSLSNRQQKGFKRREGDNSGIFKEDMKAPLWKCSEGDHILDIIPYVAGANDPMVKKGEETYVLEVFIHQGIGVDDSSKICLAQTFGAKCPICEKRKELQRNGADDDIIKRLTPSRYPRSIYNIVCYDSVKEEDKGVQVWHTSNYLMESTLLELAKKPVRAGSKNKVDSFITFADPDDGKSVVFKRKGTVENTRFVGHRFEDRDYVIDEELMEQAYCLDELILIPTYEELEEWFADVGEEEEDEPRRSRRSQVSDEDEEERRPRSSRRKKSEPVEDDDDDDDEKPVRKIKRKKRKIDVDEEEDDVDDDDEKPVRKIKSSKRSKKKKSTKDEPECPEGGELGESIDQFDYCDDCEHWVVCSEKADELED